MRPTCLFGLATAMLFVLPLTAKTVGHWSFTGTPGTTIQEGDVIPDVSPDGTHPLTLGRFTSTVSSVNWVSPVLAGFREAPYNAWRPACVGETRTNDTSYCFNTPLHDSGKQGWGSCMRVAQTAADPLDFQTFTIEFFWNNDFPNAEQGDNAKYLANWTAPFSRVLYVKDSGVAGRAPDAPSAFTFYFQSGNSRNAPALVYSWISPEGTVTTNVTQTFSYNWIPDGQWHHFALTVDGETHLVKLFIDRTQVASMKLPGDIYYGEEKASHPWCFGGYDAYGWAMVGRMDEIRLSDEALDVDHFIREDVTFPEGETLIYMPLDTDFLSVVHTNWNPEATDTYAVQTAGQLANGNPSFTADVVRSRIADADNHSIRKGNVGSVYLDDTHAQVALRPYLFNQYCHQRLTMEFFVKVDVQGPGKWAQLFEIWDVNPNNHYPVCLQQGGGNYLNVRVDTAAWDGAAASTSTMRLPGTVYDGAWHHVAFTIDGSAGTSTRVEAFIDYESKGTMTVPGRWAVGYSATFNFGNSAVAACAGQQEHLDEFRVSYGILPVSAFLRQRAEPGTMILVQ